MNNQNKIASMDAVGEVFELSSNPLQLPPDYFSGVLIAPTMSQFANKAEYEVAIKSQSDAWNEAGTKPDHPCLCETKSTIGVGTWYQYFDDVWRLLCSDKECAIKFRAHKETSFDVIQWREVQP